MSSNRILEYMFHALWTNCPFGNRAHNLSMGKDRTKDGDAATSSADNKDPSRDQESRDAYHNTEIICNLT